MRFCIQICSVIKDAIVSFAFRPAVFSVFSLPSLGLDAFSSGAGTPRDVVANQLVGVKQSASFTPGIGTCFESFGTEVDHMKAKV